MNKANLIGAVAAAFVVSLSLSAPATAAVVLVAGQGNCDLYANGCLFSHGGGGEFDNGALIQAAYNLSHFALPAPEDLPALTNLGKAEDPVGPGDPMFVNNGANWVFSNLPWNVSFYAVKSGNSNIILFGLNPASDSFTAFNTQIRKDPTKDKLIGDLKNISHVTFFSAPGGGGGNNAIPEPGAWALMILGFGAAGTMLRRRRAALA